MIFSIIQINFEVSMWTRHSQRDDVNTRIGHIVKAKLEIPDSEPIRYEVHKETSHRTSSMVKPRIMLPAKGAHNSSSNH